MATKKRKTSNVKFAENPPKEVTSTAGIDNVPITYKDAKFCKENAIQVFNEAANQFKLYTKNDPFIKRKDTVKALLKILNEIKNALELMLKGNFNDKMQNYFLVFNGTIYIYDICQFLRKSVYSSIAIEFIAFAICALEGHLVLQGVKYLDWRIKLYVELALVYEECGFLNPANKTIEQALLKEKEIKDLEESDPPIPDYSKKIFKNNEKILKAFDLKYKLQTNVLNGEAYKKKLEEYFANDPHGKIMALTECLKIHNTKDFNLIEHQGKKQWKEQAIQIAYDIIKPDIETITKGLQEIQEKYEKTMSFRTKYSNYFLKNNKKRSINMEEIKKIEEYNKNLDFVVQCISEEKFKQSCIAVPLEFHVELVKNAYDACLFTVFEDLSNSARLRCKYRRIEAPYVVDIEIIVSPQKTPNIPNGFEKIPFDLNEASLRDELSKLRNRSKIKKKDEEDISKENKKPGKDKEAKKGGKLDAPPSKEEETSQLGTAAELAQINHNYVFLCIKRSNSPEKAIFAIDIRLAHEEEEPNGPQELLTTGWRALLIPVKQYTGVRETTHMVPFLCFKQSKDSLKDENEKKTLLMDISPIIGKHPIIRPDLGYEKIEIDLRQIPKDFIKLPNNDYVFVTYKLDQMFYIIERENEILIKLYELEKTFGRETVKDPDEQRLSELDITYNMEKLRELFLCLKNCMIGPLGDQLFEARGDFLLQLSFFLWKKYMVSQLYQIEHICELHLFEEVTPEDFEGYLTIIIAVRQIFKIGLTTLNNILSRSDKVDVLFLCKLTCELTKLLELSGELREATQLLRMCLDRIVSYRDDVLSRGVENKFDVFLPRCLTCSNERINSVNVYMKDKYVEYKNWAGRKIRQKAREEKGKGLLNAEELAEEEYEILDAQSTFLSDDNRDAQFFTALEDKMQIKERDLLINAFHADILVNIFRCELKAGKMLMKQAKGKSVANNAESLQGIAENLKMKMTIMQRPTATQIKKHATELRTTLQEAGKMDPPKPRTLDYEKKLVLEENKNKYSLGLLYMMIACNKKQYPEQRYLLNLSFESICEAEVQEEIHLKSCHQDAMFILGTLLDNSRSKTSNLNFYPFNFLYNPDFIHETQIPRKPVLISRGSSFITLKLPNFNPKIPEIQVLEDPQRKVINSMSLYGKKSAHGVDVSLTCNYFNNTGIRNELASVVTVYPLAPNENYCFAVAAFNGNEELSNGIGMTSEDIATLHPLPINLLYSYLAKVAYQLGDFDVATKSCSKNVEYFCEKSKIQDRYFSEENPLLVWRLKQKQVQLVSIFEILNLTESFIIMARCMQRNFKEKETEQKPNWSPLEKQKQLLNICNFLLLAVETSLPTRSFNLSKRICLEIYNKIIPLIRFPQKPPILCQVLLKTQMLLSEIPTQFWDIKTRTLSAKLTYEIVKLTFQNNEFYLAKFSIFNETRLPNKKFLAVPKIKMVAEEVLNKPKEDKKKDAKAKKEAKKPEKDKAIEEQEPPKLLPKLVRELLQCAALQDPLEEALLSFSEEYSEFVANFIETWRDAIDSLAPYLEDASEWIDKLKSTLSIKFDFWEMLRDMNTAFLKIQATYKASPYYLEFCLKLVKRQIEIGMDSKNVLDILSQIPAEVDSGACTCESVQTLVQIRQLKLDIISKDIEWFPKGLNKIKSDHKTYGGDKDEFAINIFEKYKELENKMDFLLKNKAEHNKMKYLSTWRAEFFFIKALYKYSMYKGDEKNFSPNTLHRFFEFNKLDIEIIKNDIFENLNLDVVEEEQESEIGRIPFETGEITAEYLEKIKNKVKIFEEITEYIAYACYYCLWSKCGDLMQNCLKFLYNVMVNEALTPFQLKVVKDNRIWEYLTLISECIVQNLLDVREEHYNKKPELKDVDALESAKDPVKEEILRKEEELLKEKTTEVHFSEDKEEHHFPMIETKLTKDFWVTKSNHCIQITANLLSFNIQTLLINHKWSLLIYITRSFSNATEHFFAIKMLPFASFAKNQLFQQAHSKTEERKAALAKREADFKHWKETNKRSKTRQAMLTGEVPKEQIEFEADKAELTKQISLLQDKENELSHRRQVMESVVNELERDANQVWEHLSQTRRMLEQYSEEEKSIAQFELVVGPGDASLKARRKAQSMFLPNLRSKYKGVYDLAKRRGENFAMIQALHELGNLFFSLNNFASAEENWKTSLDSIFSKFDMIKHWRKNIADIETAKGCPLAQAIGSAQTVLSIVLLAKLCEHCFFNNLHAHRECSLLAGEMAFALFKISLPHPQSVLCFSNYVLKDLRDCRNIDPFSDTLAIDPSKTLLAFEFLCWQLIDWEFSTESLPLVVLFDYIANEKLCSTIFSVRAKLLRVVALAQIGYINEGIHFLLKVFFEKGLPTTWQKHSEFLRQEKGNNWYPGQKFLNSEYFHHEKNKIVIDGIMKLELEKNFKKKYGPFNAALFIYAKALLLFSIHESEIFEKQETNDLRIEVLKQTEVLLRGLLKSLGEEEEVGYLWNEIRTLTQRIKFLHDSEEIEKTQKEIDVLKDQVKGIMPEAEFYKEIMEEALPYLDAREARITLMVRARYLLFKVNFAMNYYSRCFYILKHAIGNIEEYCYEQRCVEKGEEKENIEMELQLADILKADPKKPGGKKEATDKKVDPKKAAALAKEEEEKKAQEEKRKEKMKGEAEFVKQKASERKFRRHLNVFWWLKVRTELVALLLNIRREKEANKLCEIVLNEAKSFGDSYFERELISLSARAHFFSGKYELAMKMFEEALVIARNHEHGDLQLGKLMGDLGEVHFKSRNFKEAMKHFEQGKAVYKSYLDYIKYEETPANPNLKAAQEVQLYGEIQISTETETELSKRGDRIKIAKKDEKKKDDPKKKDAGKGGKGAPAHEQLEMKIEPLNPLTNYDFSKDNKINYKKIEMDGFSSMMLASNSYLWKVTEPYIRICLRYIETYLLLNGHYTCDPNPLDPAIEEMLVGLTSIIDKSFNVPISFKLLLNLFKGRIDVMKFKFELNKIQKNALKSYYVDKNKSFRKLADRKPARDLCRNRYLIEVPNFSQNLREVLDPLLVSAKNHYRQCVFNIDGECLLYEWDINVEEVLMELCEICLFQREYYPRVGYKYVTQEFLEEKMKNEKKEDGHDEIDQNKNEAKIFQLNCEHEAFEYMKYAIQACMAKLELQEKFSTIAQVNLMDEHKIPKDIYFDIIEANYLYKKDYDSGLFNENKRKTTVNSLDLLTYMSKTYRESKCMTFFGNKYQKNLSKLHRYLKTYLSRYNTSCNLLKSEPEPRKGINAEYVPEGRLKIKSIYCNDTNEYRFVYILGALNKEKILTKISKEEIEKIIINEEKETLFGTFYISAEKLDNLYHEILRLKSNMLESDLKSPAAKERDYNIHKMEFQKFIESIGNYFLQKENVQNYLGKSKKKFKNEDENINADVLDKYAFFMPETNHEQVGLMIDMLGRKGLEMPLDQTKPDPKPEIQNNNLVAIFRYFHHLKYK